MAESDDMEQLLTSFKKFAVHGDTKATGKELNGKNWAKLCKDCKIVDGKTITSTDVDIVFSKVKQKTSRVITYEEFRRALEELAPKRFKGQSKDEALRSIFKLVEGREPSNVGVTTHLGSSEGDSKADRLCPPLQAATWFLVSFFSSHATPRPSPIFTHANIHLHR
ncbi:tubulin polymerization-promoting protein family member 3 isoform X3 [Larimichthys crocea]|uniref:tubulin polymerization-promoting protein family member 3 isoform X3 n=1 Tax=Larimichthys crocea TaxID=215358 RepID=UPI00054B5FCE|nr:tubulin polymerization-promoting protein family member 3 isoform X3 [Larimichthys crocea]